jgi:hypothetical protein
MIKELKNKERVYRDCHDLDEDTFLGVHGTDGVGETALQEVEVGPVISRGGFHTCLPPTYIKHKWHWVRLPSRK